MFAPWWQFSTDAVMLAVEAQSVIAMRLTSIALGRGTHAENTRMVSEKAAAFAEAAMTLATGGSAHEVVRLPQTCSSERSAVEPVNGLKASEALVAVGLLGLQPVDDLSEVLRSLLFN
jgi:hypothetical protein